jgi:peptidoglycan/LPS O-acetylase OafA/YrhL
MTAQMVGKSRGGALEALRFLAAAFIVLYHIGPEAPVRLSELSPIFARGWLATDFFLMLSGFILGRAYGRSLESGRTGAAEFFSRRFLRVWSGQAVVLGGFVILLAATAFLGIAPRHPDNFTVGEFFRQFSLTHAWGFSHHLGWNQPSWSLSVLVVCYALFAPVWMATRKLKPVWALLAAPVVMAAGALLAQGWLHESMFDLRYDAGLLRGLPLFFAGVLLSRASLNLDLTRKAAKGFVAAGLGALVVSQLVARTEFSAFAAMLAIGTVIVAADAWKGNARLAETGARISYSLYILSALTGAVWFGVIRMIETRIDVGPAGAWLLWGAFLPAAVGAAWLFERFIDAPIQRWLKARFAALRAPREQTVMA